MVASAHDYPSTLKDLEPISAIHKLDDFSGIKPEDLWGTPPGEDDQGRAERSNGSTDGGIPRSAESVSVNNISVNCLEGNGGKILKF